MAVGMGIWGCARILSTITTVAPPTATAAAIPAAINLILPIAMMRSNSAPSVVDAVLAVAQEIATCAGAAWTALLASVVPSDIAGIATPRRAKNWRTVRRRAVTRFLAASSLMPIRLATAANGCP